MSQFFLTSASQGVQLSGSYHLGVVAVSILVAVISSILALQVAGVARQNDRAQLRHIALISGSFALGGGIWSMHFIGMLALDLGIHVHYDPIITLVSIAPSVFASWVALQMLASDRIDLQQLIGGGALVGAGIGTMHYCGMMAMHTDAQIVYDPLIFALSIIAAVLLAIFALWIKFKLADHFTRLSHTQITLLAGSILGMAITSMHYLGMAAARLLVLDPTASALQSPGTAAVAVHDLVLQIGLTTLALSMLVFAGNLLLRYREVNGQLGQSEAQLRAIVDTAVDGIISIDGQGHIIAMNRAAERLFGWQLAELKGRNINVLMPEPFHSEHDGYLKHFSNGGEARIIGTGREVVAKRKDGLHVPIRLAVGKADLPGRQLFVGFVSDISERIHMERELRARETQYRTLIANMPGVTFRVEAAPPWRTLFVSEAITKLSGWAPELFIEQKLSLVSITHPDDYARVYAAVTDALRDERPYTIEFRMIDRFGKEHWVSQSASAITDPEQGITWLDGVIIDITETKKRAAEFESIVHAIGRSTLFIEFDLNGRALDANDNFLAQVNYSRSQLQRLHLRDLLCSSTPSAATDADFWPSLTRGEFHMDEFCLKARGGRALWMQASFNPIFDSDGKPWKVVALGNDLSQRKAMETDLFIAKNKAEQAAHAKGLFLANMSHEIRTPMNAIMGFTDLLRDTALAPQQRRHLDTIAQSARSLLHLLNDILDTAKLERGAMTIEIKPFSLRDLTAHLVQEQTPAAAAKGLQLTLDYPDTLRDVVAGDALRLQQILVNLLGNAVKFTPSGSVVLRLRERGERIIFKVVDTGIGIASDRLAHIFTPFTQADASMARRFGGTGLGTTIARQLAELMGGSVSAASREGEGSTFTLELPLPAASLAPVAAPHALNLAPLSLLIADDVPENLELLRLLLERDGHRVVCASDGESAFAAFTREHFDAVLMDIQMPALDGLQSTGKIREWEREHQRVRTPVIALTASVLESDRTQAAAASMDGFASKPIAMDALNRELARCLGMTVQPATPNPTATTRLTINWPDASARFNGRAPLEQALGKLLVQMPGALAALDSLESDALGAWLHRYKGLAANLGLEDLAARLAQAETDLAQSPEQRLTDTMRAQLRVDLDQLLHAVAEECAPLPGTATAATAVTQSDATAPLDHKVGALLQRARDSLNSGALDDALMSELQTHLTATQWAAIGQALENFALDEAAAYIAQLLVSATPSSPLITSAP